MRARARRADSPPLTSGAQVQGSHLSSAPGFIAMVKKQLAPLIAESD